MPVWVQSTSTTWLSLRFLRPHHAEEKSAHNCGSLRQMGQQGHWRGLGFVQKRAAFGPVARRCSMTKGLCNSLLSLQPCMGETTWCRYRRAVGPARTLDCLRSSQCLDWMDGHSWATYCCHTFVGILLQRTTEAQSTQTGSVTTPMNSTAPSVADGGTDSLHHAPCRHGRGVACEQCHVVLVSYLNGWRIHHRVSLPREHS